MLIAKWLGWQLSVLTCGLKKEWHHTYCFKGHILTTNKIIKITRYGNHLDQFHKRTFSTRCPNFYNLTLVIDSRRLCMDLLVCLAHINAISFKYVWKQTVYMNILSDSCFKATKSVAINQSSNRKPTYLLLSTSACNDFSLPTAWYNASDLLFVE